MRSLFFCTVVLAHSALLFGQPATDPVLNPPTQTDVMDDSFGQDPLQSMKIKGDVQWSDSSLQIPSEAAITKTIEGGCWVSGTFELKQPVTLRQGQQLRLVLRVEGTTNCLVRLRHFDDSTVSVALMNWTREGDKRKSIVVREQPWESNSISRIEMQYRNGLVTVKLDGESCLTSFVEKDSANVSAITLATAGASVSLDRIMIRATKPGAYSKKQQRQLAKTETAIDSASQFYADGKYQDAIDVFERVVVVQRKILGQTHPKYATTLNNIALLHNELGQSEQSEKLFKQAAQIQTSVLGDQHPSLANTLSNMANLYEGMGEIQRAEELFKQSLKIRGDVLGKDHSDYAKTLGSLGTLYGDIGKTDRAESLLKESIEVLKTAVGNKHPDYATSVSKLAALYESLGDLDRAEPLYLESLEIKRAEYGEDNPNFAATLGVLGGFYYQKSDYARAQELMKQSLEILAATVGEKHPHYPTTLNNLASVYEAVGEYAQAESLYEQALKIREEVHGKSHPAYASSLHNLAGLYENKGELDRALPLLSEGHEIIKSVFGESHPEFAKSLNLLGTLYTSQGDYTRAEAVFKQVLQVREKLHGKNHPAYADALNQLAIVYYYLRDMSRATALLEEALVVQKEVYGKISEQYAMCLNNLAVVYDNIDKFDRAEELHIECIAIRKEVLGVKHPLYAGSLNNLGMVYERQREYVKAARLCQQAAEVLESLGGAMHAEYATSQHNLAGLYDRMGDFERAKPIYEKALELTQGIYGNKHPLYAINLQHMAGFYHSFDDFPNALKYAAQAQRAAFEATCQTIPGLSEAQSRAWMDENAPNIDILISILREAKQFDAKMAYGAVWQTKMMTSRLRVGQQVPAGASDEVVQVHKQLRDARLQLASLVSATPSPGQMDAFRQALATANDEKESLEKKLAALNPASKRELAIRDAAIGDLLDQLPKGVAVIDLVRVNDQVFVDDTLELTGVNGTTETRTIKVNQPRAVYDAFLLRSDQRDSSKALATWVQLGEAEPIEEAINQWRFEFAVDNNSDQARSQARETPDQIVRRLVWNPLEKHLDGIHTVVIIPDGHFHQLPWMAIPGRKSNQHLADKYSITTVSSGQQLYGLLVDEAISTQPSLLVAGGIDYDERAAPSFGQADPKLIARRSATLDLAKQKIVWEFLNGTAAESNEVAQMWADRGHLIQLGGADADERNLSLQMQRSRFVHLATHGFFDTEGEVYQLDLRNQSLNQTEVHESVASRNPMLMTGIVASGANAPLKRDATGVPVGGDGILTAEEIAGLNLHNTELITLSACETGLGDVMVGQGVFGLQRALHQSGARSVVASLWKVDDIATQQLMKQFYTNLWVKKMSKAEALRQAQLWMLEHASELETLGVKSATRGLPRKLRVVPNKPTAKSKRTHPYFWAAFQLSGDWR